MSNGAQYTGIDLSGLARSGELESPRRTDRLLANDCRRTGRNWQCAVEMGFRDTGGRAYHPSFLLAYLHTQAAGAKMRGHKPVTVASVWAFAVVRHSDVACALPAKFDHR